MLLLIIYGADLQMCTIEVIHMINGMCHNIES